MNTIGIDAGGTLTKIAYTDGNNELQVRHYPSNDLAQVAAFINAHPEIQILGMTGGRAEQLNLLLNDSLTRHSLVEFEATFRGVNYQLKRQEGGLERCIVANIGSGTSIHYKNGEAYTRVSGTGIGGGTLVGLSALMTGEYDYHEISSLAATGQRKNIDLMVADIFEGMEVPAPLDPDLTASNFGKVGLNPPQDYVKADILATTMGLVGEVVSTLSIQLAEQYQVEHIVYIGTTLDHNTKLRDVITSYTKLKKKTAVFLGDEGFSGAIGALLYAKEQVSCV